MAKYTVKNRQNGNLTSPPTENVACLHSTSTLNRNQNIGLNSVDCLYSEFKR